MESDTEIQFGDFAIIAALPLVVGVVLWMVLAVVAGLVAPEGRRFTFFICTLLFLGPLGLHAALVSS